MISLSALENFADILKFIAGIGDFFEGLFSFLPPFIAPLAGAYITLSVIYFIVGRS